MNTAQKLAYGLLGAPLVVLYAGIPGVIKLFPAMLLRWRSCLEVTHAT